MKKALIIFSLIAMISCNSDDDTEDFSGTGPTPCVKIGAICNDGTESTSTGSGTCSSHGGVKEWKCK